ncbi:MAG: RagB/SusD family nutrient uptake outer membrane protein [Muribaculaceae bacterium]|nr:RagB/SusD family nutrient uptake outer membrane protein [Muribaculaceae bacterium]
MNKLKINILALATVVAGLGLPSCSDSFLDVSSKTESTTGNFYKTEGDAWRALIGCYDGWRQISSAPQIGFYVASTVMSDETYGATGNGDGWGYQAVDRFDNSVSPGDLNLYQNDWKAYYAGVYRCNEFLSRADDIAWLEASGNRELYLGEAHALRALLYFDMVRLWGNIPLFLEPVNENREQANPDEVYEAIFADLKFAAENIPADANLSKADNGRITRYAAEAMMARAYLFYTGYYGKEPAGVTKQEIVNYLEDIVSSHNFELIDAVKNLYPASSLVPLANSTGWDPELSTYAGEANKEVLLQMKFTPSQDYNGNNDSNRWMVMMGMRSINSSPYGKGWGACTVCPAFLNKFSADDPRRAASVIDLAAEGITANPVYGASVKDWREYTGYCVKKYSPLAFPNGNNASRPDGTGDFQITNFQNWVIMRYADVLLMVSELGGVPSMDAQAALDAVRSRSGLASIPATKENVLNERALELAFEGHRYWDLLRQGVDKLADAVCATSGTVKNGGVDATVTFERAKIIETKGLSQIPNTQITLSNGVLKQNTGWY